MLDEVQDADLRTSGGSVVRLKLPAFPNNPELVAVPEGFLAGDPPSTRYFLADMPLIGFGETLSYREVNVFEFGGSDA